MHPLDFEEEVTAAVDNIDARMGDAAVDAGFTTGNGLLVEEERFENDEDIAPRCDFSVVTTEDAVGLIALIGPHLVSLIDGETFDDADLADKVESCFAHCLAFFPAHEHDVGRRNWLGDFVEIVKSGGAGHGDGGVGREHVFSVAADLSDIDGETRLLAVSTEMLGDDGGMIDSDEADGGIDDGGHRGDDSNAGGFEVAVEREACCAPHEYFAKIPGAVGGVHLLAVTNFCGGPDAWLHVLALSGFGTIRSREDFKEETTEECNDVVRSILDDAVLVDDTVNNGECIFEGVESFIEGSNTIGNLEEVDGDVARLFDGSSGEHVDIFETTESFGEREKIDALGLVPALVEDEIGRRSGAMLTFVFLVGDVVGELVDEFTHLVEELFGDVGLIAGEAERGVAESSAENETSRSSDGFDAFEVFKRALEEAILDHGADSLDFGFLCSSASENVLDGVDQRLPEITKGVLGTSNARLGRFFNDAIECFARDEPRQKVHRDEIGRS